MVNFYCAADDIDKSKAIMQQSSESKLDYTKYNDISMDNRRVDTNLIRSAMDMDQASTSSPYQVYAGKTRIIHDPLLVKRKTTGAAQLKSIERIYDKK